jgi:hypothetical protein
MPLRLRLQPLPETIQEFELAAEERYWTGLELMTRGDGAAGIYLMGYAAEMVLKNSYFLLDKQTTPAFPVGSQLGLAKLAAQQTPGFLPQYQFKSYHDLLFWALLLVEKRRQGGRPLPPNVGLPLMQHVQRLADNWFVELRYRSAQATASEMSEVYEDVTWIRDHYRNGSLYTPRR